MPLDHSQVRSIVNANIKKMRWALQLQDWQIDVTHVHLEGDTRGECRLDVPHRKLSIAIDSDEVNDEAEVLFVLRHELLHTFDAEMELYRSAVKHLVPGDVFDAIDDVFLHAAERLILCLERMLDHGLKIGVAEMCERGGCPSEDDGGIPKS